MGDDLQKQELAQWDRQWASLEARLDDALGKARELAGEVLYAMKLLLQRAGLNKARTGRWSALLKKHGLDRKTAENWIRAYQDKAQIPASRWVVQPAKSHKKRQNNTVISTVMQPDPAPEPAASTGTETVVARVKAPDEKYADPSPEHRLPVFAIFVLTLEEKRALMASVTQHGEIEITRRMYRAAVADEAES